MLNGQHSRTGAADDNALPSLTRIQFFKETTESTETPCRDWALRRGLSKQKVQKLQKLLATTGFPVHDWTFWTFQSFCRKARLPESPAARGLSGLSGLSSPFHYLHRLMTDNLNTPKACATVTAYQLQEAISSIDNLLGDGYAQQHPELTAAVLQAGSRLYATTIHRDAIDRLAADVRSVGEAAFGGLDALGTCIANR